MSGKQMFAGLGGDHGAQKGTDFARFHPIYTPSSYYSYLSW